MITGLLRADQVAKMLGVSRPYCYKLESLGLLPSVSWAVPGKDGERRVIRFHPDDVATFIERHRARPLDHRSCTRPTKTELAGNSND